MPSKSVATAFVDLQLKTQQFQQAIGQATSSMRQFSAQMRAESEKSRESVRLLSEDLGLGIPRGLQRIIATLPGVSKAMNLAFDSVVVIALLDVVVKVGQKVEEFATKNEEAAKKNAETWKELTRSVGDVNRDLTMSNARIQDSIAKLEHKPGEGLKNALLEAADAAQKLSEKLDDDVQKLLELTTQRKVGFLDEITGHGQDDMDRTIGAGATQFRKISSSYDDTLKSAANSGDWANYNKIRQEEIRALHAGVDPNISKIGEYLRKNQDMAETNPNDPHFSKAKNGYDTLTGLISDIESQAKVEQSQHTQRGLEVGNEADAKRMKALEDLFSSQKAQFGADAVSSFWQAHINAFSKGSDEFRTVQDKAWSEIEESTKRLQEVSKQAGKEQTANTPDDVAQSTDKINQWLLEQGEDVTHTGERWKEFNAELAKGYEQYNAFAAKLKESQLKIGVSTGNVSPHSAAIQEAAIHAEEYARQRQVLQDQLAHINGDSSLTDVQRQTASTGVSNQLSELGNNYRLQSGQDQMEIARTSFSGRMTDDLNDWANKATDLGSIMSNLFTESIDSVNGAIVKLLTERGVNDPHPFRAVGHSIFTDVTKQGLQSSEGGIMKALGFGNKGVQQVYVTNMPSGLGDTVAQGPLVHGVMGALNNSNWAGGLFGGRVFGPGGLFGPKTGTGMSPIAQAIFGKTGTGPIPEGDNGALSDLDSVSSAKAPISEFAKLFPSIFGAAASAGTSIAGASGSKLGQAPVSLIPEGNDGLIMPGDIEAHATGGLLSANTWSLVGEEGPELLPPVGQTTRVYNARDTAAMLNGGGNTSHTHHYHVDARGSTDPAAVHAAVMRGIKQAAPHLVAASNQASHDMKARKPSTKG